MNKLSELFEIKSGNGLYLCNIDESPDGLNFIAMSAKNNGVVAKIKPTDIAPYPAGSITVALQGSVLSTFIQPEDFYTSLHVAVLMPRFEMDISTKEYYCICIRHNAFKYGYGRKANRTFKDIMVPSPEEIPSWVNGNLITDYSSITEPATPGEVSALDTATWGEFKYTDLFEIKKGKRLTKEDMILGDTPYLGAIEGNNGVSAYIEQLPIHEGNTISINYDGSVGEAFYQPVPYWCSDAVNVLYPKFTLNQFIAMFLITVIRTEKPRYNYGRKWGLDRMKQSTIKLPITTDGMPDWDFMESYIKCLKYSKALA